MSTLKIQVRKNSGMRSTGVLDLALALPPDKAVTLRNRLISLNIFFSDLKIKEFGEHPKLTAISNIR